SSWISAADAQVVTGKVTSEENNRAADGASWFVSTMKNEGNVVSAKWMTSGLGVYELYVNGTAVGEEVLKPGFTHSTKTKRSFTYDVTALFRKRDGAENRLSVQVTPGWWADKVVTPGNHEGMLGKKPAFRGVLELTYANGEKKLYGTNLKDWTAGVGGPVKHAAIFDGEEYDARILPVSATTEVLSTPELNTEFNGEILPSDGAEIYLRRDLALKPVETYIYSSVSGATEDQYGKIVIDRSYAADQTITLHEGETLVVDFGQNCAAVPEFVFNAAEGVELTCLPAELLNDGNGAKSRGMDGPEGSCHRTNLRIPEDGMILKYTFAASKKPVTYHPACTFFGYRFASITSSGDVTIRSIKSIPVTSIAKNLETGVITTGNELINRLILNAVWGQRSNYLSVPTDCPQRNERLGWTADTQVFTETGTFFANTDRFFHKWMRDMRDSQSELGGYPGVAPTAQYGDDMMRFGWADAGIICPWTIWKQFGDTGIIDESWDSMVRFMNHVNETKYDHKTLTAENRYYQWADWLSYEPLESCSRAGFYKDEKGTWISLPETKTYWNYLSACYWAIDAGMMADMAAASGRDAQPYVEMAAAAKDYVKSSFFTPEGKFNLEILNTMQTPALFALKVGAVEGAAREGMIARLRENFAAHDNCLQTGFLGT
ncbi:MAG: family 78 glycoside hydrolase catalytic domain, partial [Bacteroidales bacterium]|nr:family 78 glycoside hydrolase catalytic domain [Candidatus Cryptobacteroides equifaecalis]